MHEATELFRLHRPGFEAQPGEFLSCVRQSKHAHDLAVQVREGRLEFALGTLPGGTRASAQPKAHPPMRHRYVIVGRHGHPLANARSLEELLDAQWLVHSSPEEPPDMPGSWFTDLFAANGLPLPRAIIRCDGITFLTLLARTDIISAQSSRSLLFDIGRDLIAPFHLKMRTPPSFAYGTYLLLKPESPLTPETAAMVSAVEPRRASWRSRKENEPRGTQRLAPQR